MNISEFAKPVTSKALNESLAKRFGKKIKLENFNPPYHYADERNSIATSRIRAPLDLIILYLG